MMKQATFLVLFAGGLAMDSMAAVTVFSTDFSGLTNGDLNGQTSTSGGKSVTWSGDANLDVSNGTLVPATSSRVWGTFDGTTQTTVNVASEVWFSIDMKTGNTGGTNRFGLVTGTIPAANVDASVSMGQRLGGIQTRLGPWNNNAPDSTSTAPGAVTSGACETYTTTGWSANTWYTLVGKLTIDRTAGVADRFEFWYIPQGTFDYNNPGTAYITMNGIDFIQAGTQITGLVFDGNQGGLNYKNLAVSVPEPSAALLGGLGLLALARRRGPN